MTMSYVWTGMLVLSVLYGAATGNASAVGAAAMEGAAAAVKLVISVGGMLCFWSGILEVMKRCGVSRALSKALKPLLGWIFPKSSEDADTMDALSQNVSANLLGLGNAATPAGIRAAQGMLKQSRRNGRSGGGSGQSGGSGWSDGGSGADTASDELCRLVVMNTASIQLLPATVAAVRSAAGAANAFDILPAVWLSSIVSVMVGLLASKLFERAAR